MLVQPCLCSDPVGTFLITSQD